MIGLIVGTSEGKKILSLLNEFTEDIFVSTATEYGGQLLEGYKYKYLNTKPMNLEELIGKIKENDIRVLVDASHPYALEVTKNAIKACEVLGIEYVRYERPSCIEKLKDNDKLVEIKNYEELKGKLGNITGNILNTSGSRNIDKILNLNLKNRIIHRVLPTVKVLTECIEKGLKVEDIIAIKGPVSYDLNRSFIREYNAEALILKDSGVEGGTDEKLRACVDENIYAFIIVRNGMKYKNEFNSIEKVVEHLKNIAKQYF